MVRNVKEDEAMESLTQRDSKDGKIGIFTRDILRNER